MDRSNSNSEQSNLFVISSESSRSDNKQSKKENYVKFVKRVKQLLDVPGSDLDELYQKLENIVIKYFQDHKVVDFEEMYAHILSLKSNSSKMTQIVNILEKRFCKSTSKHEQARKSSKTDQFETTTINSHKQTRNSLHREDLIKDDIFNDNYAQVNSSVKYICRPNPQQDPHELTPKTQRSKQDSEPSPSKYSPTKHSPSKTNLSEEYYNRNKEYETRVQQMMKELQTIKQSISVSKPSKPNSNLRLDLKQNEQRPKERESVSSIMQIKQGDDRNIQNKQTSSKGLQGNNSTSNTYINETTSIKENDAPPSLVEAPPQDISKPQDTNHQKKIIFTSLLKNTENITKQIQELKQVASRLQIDSVHNSSEANKGSSSSIYPPDKINQLIRKVSEQKSKRQPILEQIENTTSQMNITDSMIPSFKNLPQKQGNGKQQKEIFTTELNLATTKHPVNISFNDIHSDPQQFLSSSQVVNSFQPITDQHPPYNLSTIKYVYNPYPNAVIYPNHSLYIKPETRPAQLFQPAPTAIQRNYFENKDKYVTPGNRVYVPQVSSPISSSNNLSTSIMHPHLFNRERENISLINKLQDQRIFSNPIPQRPNTVYSNPSSSKSINSASGKSIQSSLNSQSTHSLHRKGLNITTHIQKKP